MMKTKQAMFFKKSALAGLISAAFAASLPVQAGVTFDPDGPGGDPAIDLGNLDWGPTTFLAKGAETAIANFVSGAGSTIFPVYTQASLSATRDQNSATNTPAGLNHAYEITLSASFTEQVVNVIPGPGGGNIGTIVQFDSVPNGTAFAQIYYDPTLNANQLEGSGFNDGTLILNATNPVTPSTGHFSVSGGGVGTPLDQTVNGNQYTGQDTFSGDGSQGNLGVDNITVDPTFFQTPLALFGLNFANIGQTLPFVGVDPMDCFNLTPNAGGVGTVFAPSGCIPGNHVNTTYALQPAQPGYTPVVGNPNAQAASNPLAPDFVAQTDFNSPIVGTTPEPTSLALLGLGLGALGFAGGRRRRPA